MAFKGKIHKLCNSGEKVIESEEFCGLYYVQKEGSTVLLSEHNGEFAIKTSLLPTLCKELKEICDVWGDINTKGVSV